MFADYHGLAVQKILVALATIRIIRIGKVPLDVSTIGHLYILRLIELNVMLLLL